MQTRHHGSRVVHREVGSDESDIEYEEGRKVVTVEEVIECKMQDKSPPLTSIQLQLWKMCRLGDKDMLETFLKNNPGIDLDCRDQEGSTVLNEAVTKTAQFSEIVGVLLNAGAGLEVTDSLGNTPLHNAVLYYPSTQQTVDLLLEKGANVCAINNERATPVKLAEDRDLKMVLKELKKIVRRKTSSGLNSRGYSNSPDLKRKVFDRKMVEEKDNQRIIVKYNSPVVVNSPGLLKKKRKREEELDESFTVRRKRIRWCEQDSTGADIDTPHTKDNHEVKSYDNSQDTLIYTSASDASDEDTNTIETIDEFLGDGKDSADTASLDEELEFLELESKPTNAVELTNVESTDAPMRTCTVKLVPGETFLTNEDRLNRNVKTGENFNVKPLMDVENTLEFDELEDSSLEKSFSKVDVTDGILAEEHDSISSNVFQSNVKIVSFSQGFGLFVM